jgi:N6-L-threonylcarbamoyladenine synthase
MTVLALETSCDDTAAAVVAGGHILSNIVSSQLAHREWGGVVPEVASRAHQRYIVPVVRNALETANLGVSGIDAVACTFGPGLVGSLLVGLSFAKGMAVALGVPFVGVNHLDGHLYSPYAGLAEPPFPFLALVVSGGHTELLVVESWTSRLRLGRTRDDAAGEAFDKVAKLLGLPYPGGPAIESAARSGKRGYRTFPRADLEGYDYSFSGIKTSVLYHLKDVEPEKRSDFLDQHRSDIAASFQEAMIQMILSPLRRAIIDTGIRNVAISGGVSANAELRVAASEVCRALGADLAFARADLRTDNAAMIGLVAYYLIQAGQTSPLSLNVEPSAQLVQPAQIGQDAKTG